MNPTPSFDSVAAEQAALWAARLDGSLLSPADQAALDAWLAEAPAHRAALEHYCQFSLDLDEALPSLVRSGAVRIPAAARPRRRVFWLASMSLLAAAAAIVLVLHLVGPATQLKDVATTVAQRQSITLADGTRIDLNARTTVQVDLRRSERHVRLSGGEAFFAVSKDKSRPFTVDTPAGSVRVTGTAFNVRTENAPGLEVTVLEGSVRVSPNASGSPVLLGPGQKLTAQPSGVSVRALSDTALADELAWREGKIVFDGTPLREALERFSRYQGFPITADADAAGLRLGGRYSLDDLNGFFSALEQTLPVRVIRDHGSAQVRLRTDR